MSGDENKGQQARLSPPGQLAVRDPNAKQPVQNQLKAAGYSISAQEQYDQLRRAGDTPETAAEKMRKQVMQSLAGRITDINAQALSATGALKRRKTLLNSKKNKREVANALHQAYMKGEQSRVEYIGQTGLGLPHKRLAIVGKVALGCWLDEGVLVSSAGHLIQSGEDSFVSARDWLRETRVVTVECGVSAGEGFFGRLVTGGSEFDYVADSAKRDGYERVHRAAELDAPIMHFSSSAAKGRLINPPLAQQNKVELARSHLTTIIQLCVELAREQKKHSGTVVWFFDSNFSGDSFAVAVIYSLVQNLQVSNGPHITPMYLIAQIQAAAEKYGSYVSCARLLQLLACMCPDVAVQKQFLGSSKASLSDALLDKMHITNAFFDDQDPIYRFGLTFLLTEITKQLAHVVPAGPPPLPPRDLVLVSDAACQETSTESALPEAAKVPANLQRMVALQAELINKKAELATALAEVARLKADAAQPASPRVEPVASPAIQELRERLVAIARKHGEAEKRAAELAAQTPEYERKIERLQHQVQKQGEKNKQQQQTLTEQGDQLAAATNEITGLREQVQQRQDQALVITRELQNVRLAWQVFWSAVLVVCTGVVPALIAGLIQLAVTGDRRKKAGGKEVRGDFLLCKLSQPAVTQRVSTPQDVTK